EIEVLVIHRLEDAIIHAIVVRREAPRLVALHPRLLLLGPAPQSPLWRRRARQQAREPDDRGGDCIVYHCSWMILSLFHER
ncbi:hypothetical protein BHE74_00006126, partial [Ensete ventricosum]